MHSDKPESSGGGSFVGRTNTAVHFVVGQLQCHLHEAIGTGLGGLDGIAKSKKRKKREKKAAANQQNSNGKNHNKNFQAFRWMAIHLPKLRKSKMVMGVARIRASAFLKAWKNTEGFNTDTSNCQDFTADLESD